MSIKLERFRLKLEWFGSAHAQAALAEEMGGNVMKWEQTCKRLAEELTDAYGALLRRDMAEAVMEVSDWVDAQIPELPPTPRAPLDVRGG